MFEDDSESLACYGQIPFNTLLPPLIQPPQPSEGDAEPAGSAVKVVRKPLALVGDADCVGAVLLDFLHLRARVRRQ